MESQINSDIVTLSCCFDYEYYKKKIYKKAIFMWKFLSAIFGTKRNLGYVFEVSSTLFSKHSTIINHFKSWWKILRLQKWVPRELRKRNVGQHLNVCFSLFLLDIKKKCFPGQNNKIITDFKRPFLHSMVKCIISFQISEFNEQLKQIWGPVYNNAFKLLEFEYFCLLIIY